MPEHHLESVERIVKVLDYLIAHPADVGVSELSRELGYSKSVVHRILTALETHGYVAGDGRTHRYQLGARMFQLGLAAINRLSIRRLALRRMERLRSATGETVTLSGRVGDRRTYIESLESHHDIRVGATLGRDMELYLGAGGKAILAFLPERQQERIMVAVEGSLTALHGPLALDTLRRDLEAVKRRSYALSLGERVPGIFSVAAPVFDDLGQVVASIGIIGPMARWREELAEEYGALVVEEARKLSRDLGYADEMAAPVATKAPITSLT